MAGRRVERRKHDKWRALDQSPTQFASIVHPGGAVARFVNDRQPRAQSPEPANDRLPIAPGKLVKDDQYATAGRKLADDRPELVPQSRVGDQPLPIDGLASRHARSYSAPS